MIDDYNHSLTGGLKAQMLPSAIKHKGITVDPLKNTD